MKRVLLVVGLLGLLILDFAIELRISDFVIDLRARSLLGLIVGGLIGWDPFLLRVMLAPVARISLYLMGWKQLDPSVIQKLSTHARVVIIFSHTGYSDFILMILYILAYPRTSQYFKTLIKPEPFAYAGLILRWLGGIPATRVDDTNGGAVDRIVGQLESYPRFALLLSPKGTIVRRPWRSGYYHIASHFQIPLMVIGADYERKCLVASDAINQSEGQPAVQSFLETQLQDIVPLVPEAEIVSIRPHDPSKLFLVDPERIRTFGLCGGVVCLCYALVILI